MSSLVVIWFGLLICSLTYCATGAEVLDTCQAASCNELASKLAESMNGKMSPCEDFYEYSCSNFKNKGGATGNTDPTKGIETELNQELLELLQQSKKPSEPIAVHKAKEAFAACMNDNERRKSGNAALLKTLNEFGGWPILRANTEVTSSSNSSEAGWTLAGKLRRLGYSLLVKVNVNVDQRDPNRHIIVLDSIDSKNPLPGPENFFAYLGMTAAHSKFMQGVVELLGSNITDQTKEDIKQLLRFQINIDRIITPNHESREATRQTYDVMTLSALNKLTKDKVNWIQYLNVIFRGIKSFGPNDEVLVLDREYLNKLVELLSTTQPRVIHNYLLWRVIKDVAEDGDDQMVALLADVLQSGANPKSETCVKEVKGFLGYAVANLYVRNSDSTKILPKATEIVLLVKKSFEHLIDQSSWMDSETKTQAKAKLRNMAVKTGYPSWILDPKKMDEYYRNINVSQQTHFENILSMSLFYSMQELLLIKTIPDRSSWAISPLMANAFYHRTLNAIYIPISMLRPPFFHAEWPVAAIFGSIGAVAGHEITHGFEDGSLLLARGGGQLTKWWSTNTTTRYLTAANCVAEKYDKFCYPSTGSEASSRDLEPKLCVNGQRTLRENVADIGGTKAAFHAYQEWKANHANTKDLARSFRFNPTSDQLFFLSNAQIWCGHPTSLAVRMQFLTSTNSPSKYRLLGSIAELSSFREVFNCTNTKSLQEKCNIW